MLTIMTAASRRGIGVTAAAGLDESATFSTSPNITTLPFGLTLNTTGFAAQVTDNSGLSAGAAGEIITGGAYDGSDCYRFTPPTDFYQGRCGIGTVSIDAGLGYQTKLYWRYLIKYGAGITITNQLDNKTSFMYVTPDFGADERSILMMHAEVLSGGLSWRFDEGGDAIFGTESTTIFVGGPTNENYNQWICVERWLDLDADECGYTLTKRDGTTETQSYTSFPNSSANNYTHVTSTEGPGFFMLSIAAPQPADCYHYMSHILYHNAPIGTPTGFVTG